MSDTRNSRSLVLTGLMAGMVSLFASAGDPAHAASMAHVLPTYAGDAVRIVTPPRLAIGVAHSMPQHRAYDAQAEALNVSIQSAIAKQAEQERRVSDAPQEIFLRIDTPVLLIGELPYCQRGLFGRTINEPCRAIPDATFPQGR